MIKHIIKPIVILISLFLIFFLLSFLFSFNTPTADPHFGVLDLTDYDMVSQAVSIPDSSWEFIPDSGLEPENSLVYKLTIMATRENTYGFIIPNTVESPLFYINGAYQNVPDKNTEDKGYNIYYYTPRTNKIEATLQYPSQDVNALNSNGVNSSVTPIVVFGGQNLITDYTSRVFLYESICAGYCLFCVYIGFAWYFVIYKKSVYIYYALTAVSAFFLFILGAPGFMTSLFIGINSVMVQKLYAVAVIATAGLLLQFSVKLFESKFNYWVCLGYKLYCIICAVVSVFAPISILNFILTIFEAISAAIAAYIFIILLSSYRKSGNTATVLWMTSAVLITAFLAGTLTNQIDDKNLLRCAILTALSSGALCLKLSSGAISKKISSYPEPTSAFSEAMQIVNRLNYIKSQLLAGVSSNPAIAGFNEVSANPNLNRRQVGISEDEELRRDLKNISAEANRLSLLAQRMLNAAYSDRSQIFGKVQLSKCAEKAYDLCSPMFEDKNNSFTLETEPWMPYVFGEEDQVMQVIIHLLTNSNDRTKNGTVMMQVARGKNKRSVQLGIHDTGDIIEPEAMQQLFSANNVPPEDAEIFGLYVARTILESMNSKLIVKSDIKGGTYLVFELPDFHEDEE